MAKQDKDQHLDEMLDSLLASYSNEDPRPGMEMRIQATLEAHTRQRRRNWILVFAGSVAVILLAVAITNERSTKQPINIQAGVPTPLPESVPGNTREVATKPRTANIQFVHQRREEPSMSEDRNRAILQMAEATQTNLPADESPSEPVKLPPAPVRRQNPEPAIAQLPPAPVISVRDIGVPTMEIKELTPTKELNSAKDADEKGNL